MALQYRAIVERVSRVACFATIGFLLAGFIAQFGNGFFNSLFVENAPQPIPTIENVIVGPLIAVASVVCSIGNVPLAAVLWSGGISFAGGSPSCSPT